MSIEATLREEARRLLERGEVEAVIGWRKGEGSLRGVVYIAEAPKEVEHLTFGPLCQGSTANFVKRVEGRVAVVARGCDARALNVLIQEGQVRREDLFILGVRCPGMVDLRKLLALLGGEPPPSTEVEVRGEEVAVKTEGEEALLRAREVLRGSCLSCEHPDPVVFDLLIGKEGRSPAEAPYAEVEEFELRPPDERWAFWEDEFGRCVRCFACRNACPVCYCEPCVFQAYPFLDRSSNFVANGLFHLVRAMHVAGRCVNCGECEAACPEGIPMRLLYRRLEKEIRERFGYLAGIRTDLPPVLGTYGPEDRDEFIR